MEPSTPNKYRSKLANINQISTDNQGVLPYSGCNYEQLCQKQIFQPSTPQPAKKRRNCLKRKRVETQNVQHLEQSYSLEYENMNLSENKAYKDALDRGKLLEKHIWRAQYFTRRLISSALSIFAEFEVAQRKAKRKLSARGEWRSLLKEDRESNLELSNQVSVFIKNVGGVQGERCYSQWKGSVLDSVIGAFLAQNTSDQLSSSAFMSLAGHFPPQKPRYELSDAMDSVHWDGVRQAKEKDVSDIIAIRGNSKRLAMRIQAFLDGLVNNGKGLNLEDLRDVAAGSSELLNTEFLQDFVGMGPKSVECVRLLTLEQKAFPVDTHVARVTIRLGWTPIPRVLDELQVLGSEKFWKAVERVKLQIHQYLWSRLCDLDHKTLYELHCQMITFGKVFCTKNNPNCSGCPMRDDCKYYKSKAERVDQISTSECLGGDIEDIGYNTRSEKTKASSSSFAKKKSPQKPNKRVNRVTEHVVYQLPDNHPLLENMNTREIEDSNPYLLFVWEQGESTNQGKDSGSSRQLISGTIMIPSRTAVRGSFPLNGTFFQFNEVFADHKTSKSPIKFPLVYLEELPKKALFCGTSIAEIAKGLQGEDVSRISRCFNEGYICTREYDKEMCCFFNLHKRFKVKPLVCW